MEGCFNLNRDSPDRRFSDEHDFRMAYMTTG